MEALIRLIYLAGVLKSGRLNTEELWTYIGENHQRVRAIQSNIPKTIILRLKEILNISQPEPVHDRQNMRGRCAYCDRKKNRPTRYSCKTCGKFMCLEHASFICSECNVK
nr:unnamed protein product [Callosobruchus analis]